MIDLKQYKPHLAQQTFHYLSDKVYRYMAMICGIRSGKTYAGARQSLRLAWNSKESGVFGIIAPTFPMLKKTTWREFVIASRPFIARNGINETDKIIKLKNGREVHGFSADKPDRIRNATLCGFWLDEGRECKDGIWDLLLGRVLSTDGRGILTTSPNSFDWIHEEFIEKKDSEYGVMKFTTYDNIYLKKDRIDALARKYDEKFMQQELLGEFVIFEGQVYYTFNRRHNAGDLAFKVAQYNPTKSINLCCDFNVNPMAWVITQFGKNKETELAEVYVIDEIFLKNSNTEQCCKEFKSRYGNHQSGLFLYGDETGKQRHTSSNVTDWKIIQRELAKYNPITRVPSKNPAERDRINAVNGLICNSKGERRVFVNPKCKHVIRDFEQVSYKEGSVQIDKTKDLQLTHPSDAFGYMADKEFGLGKGKIEGLPI